MTPAQIINSLIALEVYFEEGRRRAYSTRKKLERFYAPAPKGGTKKPPVPEAQVIHILNKRHERIKRKSK